MQFSSRYLILGLSACLLMVHHGTAQTFVATPSTVVFNQTVDSPGLPPAQTIQITSSSGNVPFVVSVVPASSGGGPYPVFLSATPSSGTTPATLTLSVLPTVLSWGYGGAGNYVAVSSSGSCSESSPCLSVVVSILLNLPPPPSVKSILNASSLQSSIAPGTIVTIFGDHIGPRIPAFGQTYPVFGNPIQYFYPGLIGNSKVSFSGHAAPILFANANQINAIVPYEVAGQSSVDVVVSHSLVAGPALTVPLLDTSPGVFTVTQNGAGQGAILNQNGTLNSTENPAPAGSIVQIYASGAGLWTPNVATGLQLSPSPPFPVPAAPVSVTIGGQSAQLTYSGAAPGLISGMLQVNAIVPAGLSPGPQSVLLKVGRNSNSQQPVTITVQ